MAERLNRYWRIGATGFCFAVFGLGGLLMGGVAYPMLCLFKGDGRERAIAAKRIICLAQRLFVGLLIGTGILTLEVRGREKLQREGLLIIANHPSLIDVVFLISLIERADCIVKAALVENPFTRGPIRAAGYVVNNSGSGLVEDCIASLRAGNNLIIFPEGTRTPLSGEAKLQRGAANIAVRGKFDITPVRIRCAPPMLMKGEKWYRVPVRRAHFLIEVDDDIPICEFAADERAEALAARHLTDFLAAYFFPESCRAQS